MGHFHRTILLLLLIGLSSIIHGQTDSLDRKNKFFIWASTGGQLFSSGNLPALLGMDLSANASFNNKHFIKLKYYAGISTDQGVAGLDSTKSNRMHFIESIALQYGYGKYISNSIAFVPSIGPSHGTAWWIGKYLTTTYSSSCLSCYDHAVYDEQHYEFLGILLGVEFIWTTPVIGSSLELYANINKHPDFGLTLNLLLGKIRQRN